MQSSATIGASLCFAVRLVLSWWRVGLCLLVGSWLLATPRTGWADTFSFSNTGQIMFPSGTTVPASPYPSDIVVSGSISGTINKVAVSLNLLNHEQPDDIDILLVGPTGANLILMSDAGGLTATGIFITLTFDDAAAAALPDNSMLTAGTYKPTDYGLGDSFPSPAPATTNASGPAGSATFASAFNGTDPTGTWSLYVLDDFAAGVINGANSKIANGWSLNITVVPEPQIPLLLAFGTLALLWRQRLRTTQPRPANGRKLSHENA